MNTFKLYFTKFIVLLVALQILNTGLFAQDFELLHQSTCDETNLINSVTEYVAEVVMKIKDAFPEHNDPASQSHRKHIPVGKTPVVKIITPFNKVKIIKTNIPASLSSFKQQLYFSFIKEIIPPPPKV